MQDFLQHGILIIIVVSVVLFVMLAYMRSFFSSATNQKITYDAFIEKVEKPKNNVFCYGDFFSDDELSYIDCFLEKSEIFAVFWTRKEALIKRFGLRICDGLKFSCFEKETRSFILNSVYGQKYAFSYSFSGDDVDIYRYNGVEFSKFFKIGRHVFNNKTIFAFGNVRC